MQLTQDKIDEDVKRALAEDLGSGDVSALLLSPEVKVRAEIISREPLLVCGQPWVNAVFFQLNPDIKINWFAAEGQWLAQKSVLCHIEGRARDILSGERTALNFLQTLSATATQTWHYLGELQSFDTKLLDTRKTLPSLRLAQKYAVACAGGMNHRLGLFDAFLIKENHIKSCGSITKAINRAREIRPDLFVEVEVENLEELQEALAAKPDRIMLDNFSVAQLKEAVAINRNFGCQLEASGGINLTNIKTIAATGVDYISIGEITKSIKAIDLSLLIKDVT